MPAPPSPAFKLELEAMTQTILMDYVGINGIYADTDNANNIQRWDNKLGEFNLEEDLPMCVIFARQTAQSQQGQHEYGTDRELWNWMVNIYYLDVESGDTADFQAGRIRQGQVVERMRNALENEPRMRGLSVQVNPTSPSGAFNEYVWDNDWGSVVWDQSGQEGYWAYTAEMTLLVKTARN